MVDAFLKIDVSQFDEALKPVKELAPIIKQLSAVIQTTLGDKGLVDVLGKLEERVKIISQKIDELEKWRNDSGYYSRTVESTLQGLKLLDNQYLHIKGCKVCQKRLKSVRSHIHTKVKHSA